MYEVVLRFKVTLTVGSRCEELHEIVGFVNSKRRYWARFGCATQMYARGRRTFAPSRAGASVTRKAQQKARGERGSYDHPGKLT